MGIIGNIKEEIRIIRERDPAIHSSMEVFLYPSFKVMLHYRLAHKLYRSAIFFWPGGFRRGGSGKRGLKSIRERRLAGGFLLITEMV